MMPARSRRIAVFSIFLFLMLTSLPFPEFPVEKASATIRYVPSVYPKIQAAIDASNPWDVIEVQSGVYNEDLDFYAKYLTIKGVGSPVLNGKIVADAQWMEPPWAYLGGGTIIMSNFTVNGNVSFLESEYNSSFTNCIFNGASISTWADLLTYYLFFYDCSFNNGSTIETGQNGYVNVYDSLFNNNTVGIFSMSPFVPNGFKAKNCTFSNNGHAVHLEFRGSGIVENCTFINNDEAIWDDHAYGAVINCTFTNNNIDINNSWNAGYVDVYQYLHVRVLDLAGNPVTNVHVTMNNSKGTEKFNGFTNPDGWVTWVLLMEYSDECGTPNYYTPHKIFVSKDGYDNNHSIYLDQSKYVSITLDILPPPSPTSSPLVIHTIYGRVLRGDHTPKPGAPVECYVYNASRGEHSRQLSMITTPEGYFHFELSQLRNDTWDWFQYNAGDSIRLYLDGDVDGSMWSNASTVGVITPQGLGDFVLPFKVTSITFDVGWNLYTPHLDFGSIKIGDLAAMINGSIGPNYITQITRWTSTGWNSWIAAIPWVNNFTLNYSQSYFIRIEGVGQCTWDISDYGFTEPHPVYFHYGWNAVGVAYHTAATQTASDVSSQIDDQNGVDTFLGFANWTGAAWNIYINQPVDDFDLDMGLKPYASDANPVGYFVRCSKSGVWMPT